MRKVLTLYAVLGALLWAGLEKPLEPEAALPPLPAEAAVAAVGQRRDFCGSDFWLASLSGRSFRWAFRPADRPRLWAHGLTVLCEEIPPASLRVAVLYDDKPVYRTTYQRVGGFDGDNVTARVAARLLSAQPEVAAAAVRAFLANQAEVARAGADLWRAGRWSEAVDSLWLSLENDWDERAQADLHFGLADGYARLGRPRQAYWHALAYLKASAQPPPAAWVKGLRGVSGLLTEQPANVEPAAAEGARRWRQAAAAQRWDTALPALKGLCQEAPWAAEYQESVAAVYERLGWGALGEIWRRRAARTRELSADAALQARLAELTH